jgi:tetratricopeptide (TPR) repeat protein
MSTLTHLLSNAANKRRPLLLMAVAALILTVTVAVRLGQGWLPPKVDRTPAAAIDPGSPQGIGQMEARLQRNPDDVEAYALMGLGWLQQVRETGDVSLYARAGQAFDQALQHDPKQLDALIGRGILALALHDFTGALSWADEAWALNPYRAQTLGLKVDALVELGRYPEAVETLQQMVDLRPDLASYTRVSYLRELHGEVEGAIEAMRMAAQMGVPGSEQWLWTTVQLGNLYWSTGRLDEAEATYRQALQLRSNYAYALAGLARVQAAHGDNAAAITELDRLSKRLPLPEFVVTLGELYEMTGQPDLARQQYDLVRTMQKLNAASGMNVDLELATFEVNHGDNPQAALAQAKAAYQVRPTIYAADTLAWAYYHVGDLAQAAAYSQEALRLNTQDALLHFHAGMIAAAWGDDASAREHLRRALAINPAFSVLHADRAKAKIDDLNRIPH